MAAPELIAVTPPTTVAGAAAVTHVLTGVGFDSAAVVKINGTTAAGAVVWTNANKMTVVIDPTALPAGTLRITVENPGPPVAASAAQYVVVAPAAGTPIANYGVPGNAFTTLAEYLDDRKWLFWEQGMQTVWEELYLLSTTTNDPQKSALEPVSGRYRYKVAGSPPKSPPTTSRVGVPGSTP